MSAQELIEKVGGKESAIACCEVFIADLLESLAVANEYHPCSAGMIAGMLAIWTDTLNELIS